MFEYFHPWAAAPYHEEATGILLLSTCWVRSAPHRNTAYTAEAGYWQVFERVVWPSPQFLVTYQVSFEMLSKLLEFPYGIERPADFTLFGVLHLLFWDRCSQRLL